MSGRFSVFSSARMGTSAVLTASFALIGCGEDSPVAGNEPEPSVELSVELVAQGLEGAVHLTAPPLDDRVFVVEQPGRIRIIASDGSVLATPFLDITDRVRCCGERGLLSVAFHPMYATNGWFFVNYTGEFGVTRVERYRVSANPDLADANSAKLILEVDQPFSNHNGGLNLFGPDGMLYVGLGDGGSAGDPHGNGQNLDTLLGSILRIDVDGGDPYLIPTDNPFRAVPGARGEIWAYGLRNPWRFSFDQQLGQLYIADVGQNSWEEVNRVDATLGGVNYGWSVTEGAHCFGGGACDQTGLTPPILEYGHGEGCSITGGHVYRGSAIPELVGQYFYADYCRGWVRSFEVQGSGEVETHNWDVGGLGPITSFGEDGAGELYFLTEEGRVHRITGG